MRFSHYCWRSFFVLILLIAAFARESSLASTLDYTMRWSSVTGMYDGTIFREQPLQIDFIGVDTNDIRPFSIDPASGLYEVPFVNGAKMRLTLGSILTDAPLDDVPRNGSVLLAQSGATGGIFLGTLVFDRYGGDRASLGGWTGAPATSYDKLATDWSSLAPVSAISTGFETSSGMFSGYQIDNKLLSVVPQGLRFGSWNAPVPEPSTYAMALAGVACGGFSMWRRRKRA